MKETPSDRELSPDPRSDPNASEFELHLEPILASALKNALYLCRNREDAEDLVQEAAVQAFRGFESFERGTNFKAWFLRVQHNCFLGRVRASSRRPQTVQVEAEETVEVSLFEQTKRAGLHKSDDPAGALLARLDGAQIAGALRALPPEYRVVATLYFVEELGYEQIAQIVDCPLNTVRSRLHRSRKLLQSALWELAQERGLETGAAQKRQKEGGKKEDAKPSRGLKSWLLMLLLPLNAAILPALSSNSKRERASRVGETALLSRAANHHVSHSNPWTRHLRLSGSAATARRLHRP